jgi:cobalt-zinc-cadmium efflux system outer membrane protein
MKQIWMRVFSAAVLAASACWAQRPTLDQLIDEALQTNLRLIAERYSVPIADARIIQARLRPNPTILAQAQYIDAFGLGFSLRNPAGPPELDLGLMLPIVRGGKRAARIDNAEWAKSTAEADFLNAARNLILDVQMAFVDFLVARDAVAVHEETRKALASIAEENAKRVGQEITALDVARSRLAALQSENLLLLARRKFRQMQFRLQKVVGRGEMDLGFDVGGSYRREEAPALAQLQETALRNRPDLTSAQRNVDRARSFVRLQQTMAKPDWTLYSWVNRQWNIGIVNGTSLTFQWNVPLPISDRNQGEIARGETELEQAATNARALEREIRAEVAAAHSYYESAREILALAEGDTLMQAREVREAMHRVYMQGEEPLDVLLDAQKFFDEAVLSVNEAKAELARSLYVLEAMTGTGRR